MSTTPLDDATPSDRPATPYPGLRPFEKQEWSIFFGRETMVQDVVTGLLDRHLVAVHGESGCGKSSLVRAGVLPFLESDQTRAGGSWRTVEFRPGDSPLANLSAALQPLSGEDDDPLTIRRLIMRGESAPAKIAAHLGLTVADNLCILFDQFEELFEHARRQGPTEAEILTGFLVSLALNPPAGLHVIVTMRSDYLGQCAHWRGFAETVNATQYLVPRMERPALWRAIREPATLFGGTLSPELTERVIAEAGYGQDQLPLIQHGLMRLWQRKTGGDPDAEGWRLDLPDYRALDGGGGLAGILSDHADACLQDKDEQVAEAIFRALADRNADGEAIRRPQTLQQLADVAGTTPASVADVLAPFRAAGAAFIRPGGDTPLTPETRIDIGHESFLRSWRRIADPETGWLKKETDDGLRWMSLRLQARDFATSRRLLADGAEKDASRLMARITAAWANRHGGDWREVKELVEQSQEAAAARKRRSKRTVVGAVAAAVVFAVIAVFAVWQTNLARLAEEKALEASRLAIVAGEEAKAARDAATLNESVSLAALSRVAASEGQYADAVKLALAAWPRKGDEGRPPLKTTVSAFSKSLPELNEVMRIKNMEANIYTDGENSISGFFGYFTHPPAFSPDGTKIVASVGGYRSAIFDVANRRPTGTELAHANFVDSAAFSRAGDRVLTTSRDGLVRIWEATGEGRLIKKISMNESIHFSAYSPSNKYIITVSGMNFSIWDGSSGAPIGVEFSHNSRIEKVIFSPDENKVVTTSADQTTRLWDVVTGQQVGKTMQHFGQINSIIFSNDGSKILTASSDKTARIWNSDNGESICCTLQHSEIVSSASFSFNDLNIVTTSGDKAVRIWKFGSVLQLVSTIEYNEDVINATYSRDNKTIMVVTGNSVYEWDLEKSRNNSRHIKHLSRIHSAVHSPNENYIATSSYDGTTRVWMSARTDIEVTRFADSEMFWSAIFSPLGDTIITESRNKKIVEWSIFGRKMSTMNQFYDNSPSKIKYSPNQKYILAISTNNIARIWDIDEGTLHRRLFFSQDFVTSGDFSPDGRFLALGYSDGSVKQWDLTTKMQQPSSISLSSWTVSVTYSPDSTKILTLSRDNKPRMWEAKTGKQISLNIQNIPSAEWAIMSPDWSLLYTRGNDNIFRIWDVKTGRESRDNVYKFTPIYFEDFSPDGEKILTLSNVPGLEIWRTKSSKQVYAYLSVDSFITRALFSPENHRIAIASSKNFIEIIDSETGISISNKIEHNSYTFRVQFSPNGNLLLTVSDDKTARIWDISNLEKGNAFEVACQRLGNNTDLSDVIAKYGLGKLTPICGENMPILPDMSTLQ